MPFNRVPMTRQDVEDVIRRGAELTRHPTGDRFFPRWWRSNRQALLDLFDSLGDNEGLVDLRVVQEYDAVSLRPKREGIGVLLTSRRLGLLRSDGVTWVAFDPTNPESVKLQYSTDRIVELTVAEREFVWYFEFGGAEAFAEILAPDRFVSFPHGRDGGPVTSADHKSNSDSALGAMVIIPLGIGAAFAMQRLTVPVPWRVMAGIVAFLCVFCVAVALTEKWRTVLRRTTVCMAFLSTVGVGIASATPVWRSVPTSGAPTHAAMRPTETETSTTTDSPTTADTTTPDDPTEDPNTLPMHDPGNWNTAWIPCKEQLGYGGISDYALTDTQEARVVACVMYTNITSGQ